MSHRFDYALDRMVEPSRDLYAFFALAKAQGSTYAEIHNAKEINSLDHGIAVFDARRMAQNTHATRRIQTPNDPARALGSSIAHIDAGMQLVGLA